MRRTIIDLYISNNPYDGETERIDHYNTFADFPLRGATVSTSREGVLALVFDEIELLFKNNIPFIRMFDMYELDYFDFYKDVENQV